MAQTLLALLNLDYMARLFDHDLKGPDLDGPGTDRALIGNDQTLGLFEPGELSALKTRGQTESYRVTADNELTDRPEDQAQLRVAIGWYQAAASLLSGAMESGREVVAERR